MPVCLLTREDLPVAGQHLLPDDLPHDLHADAEQLGDGRVRVVEAVQQNLRHLSLLLPYQPSPFLSSLLSLVNDSISYRVVTLAQYLILPVRKTPPRPVSSIKVNPGVSGQRLDDHLSLVEVNQAIK